MYIWLLLLLLLLLWRFKLEQPSIKQAFHGTTAQLDAYVYLSKHSDISKLDLQQETPVWTALNFRFNESGAERRSESISISLPSSLNSTNKNNCR